MEERRTSLEDDARSSGKLKHTDSESEIKDISEEDGEPREEVDDKSENKSDDQEREE